MWESAWTQGILGAENAPLSIFPAGLLNWEDPISDVCQIQYKNSQMDLQTTNTSLSLVQSILYKTFMTILT